MKKKFINPFISFKFKNFKIYWIGMNISLIGSWMQSIAQPWLALSITNDAFLVSLVAVAQFLPPLFLTLISGALIDKFNTKKLLFISQTGFMLTAFGFTFMMIFFTPSYVMILLLAFINGIFFSIDVPTRQTFIYELIDDDKFIPNAVALNSMSFNVARILGPAAAGIVIATLGIMYCFLINALTFLAIMISLFFIKNTKKIIKTKTEKNMLYSIKNGIIYAKNNYTVALCLFVLLIIALFLPHYNIAISAFAKFSLGGGEKTFGYLMSFLGVGAFLGALYIATFGKLSLKKILIAPFLSSLSYILAGILKEFYLSGIFLGISGFFFVVTLSSLNSTIQLNTKNEYRGRVMSIYSLFFQGSIPFGALFTGYFADKLNPVLGMVICALSCMICLGLLIILFKKREKGV